MRQHASQREPTTAVGEHIGRENHKIKDEEVKVLARESNTWQRKIREAVEIRTHKPEMNKDNGYDLPAIYNNILQQHPQGVGGAHAEGLTSPPLKKASDGQKLRKSYNIQSQQR